MRNLVRKESGQMLETVWNVVKSIGEVIAYKAIWWIATKFMT